MAKELNYKEDIEKKQEEEFRRFYDFYRNNYKIILVFLVLILLFGVARNYYKQQQNKKMVEQLVQEKLDEIKQEENNTVEDVGPNYMEMFNQFSIDELIDYLNENEDIRNLFSEQEYEELMKMLKGVDGLYDFFSHSSP